MVIVSFFFTARFFVFCALLLCAFGVDAVAAGYSASRSNIIFCTCAF